MPKRLAMVLTVLFTLGVGSVLGADTWTLVKDANDLAVGDEVVIAANGYNYAMGSQNSNNRASVAITKNGDNITWTGEVQLLTIQAGTTSGTFAFYTGSEYLYAASSSSNYLRTQTTNNANGSWTISITSAGVATIKATGTNSRNWLRFNNGNSPKIFSCYSSGQSDVCIYKKAVSCTKPTIAFDNGSYTIGGTALDLSTLFTSNSNGTVTYSVTNANSTGATISGSNFTATAAGSATVTATQAAAGTYCDGSATATISVSKASCNNKVTVGKGTPSNGSFNVSKNGTYETCDGALVITLSNITPDEGYQFGKITQDGINTGVTIDQENKKVTYEQNTSGTSTINVTFNALPTHTVTWIVNGKEYTKGTPTASVYEGAKWSSLTLPTAPNPNDYCGQVFAGWTTTNIGSTGLDKDNDATAIQNLNLMTSENKSSKTNTITDKITFYAVFADYAD